MIAPRIVFLILFCLIGVLWHIIGYWRRKTGEAAYAAARMADNVGERVLERNYRITGDIKGKEIVIADDVLTTGRSVANYKEEIKRCGGKVVAIFYGKTVTVLPLFLVKLDVWSKYLTS